MKTFHRLALLMCIAVSSACATATTVIRSTPPNAIVFIDEEPVGTTPIEVRLRKESHRIRLEKEGYTPVTDYLSIVERDPGLLVVLSFPLYWIFADDFKYTFKPAYDFELRAVEHSEPHRAPEVEKRQSE